jgi:uncharacterized membrane protein YeaQ/YmgE (transglycosylase-associated protein family)
MGIIAWIILGALAGWIASMIMGTDARQGALANIVVGIIGAFIGGIVMRFFGQSGVSGFNLYSVVVAVVGACIALGVYRALSGRSHRSIV